MSKLILAAVAMFSISAFADADDFALVTCDVKTEADAQKCMEREAAAQQDYEEPNDGFATSRTDMLAGIFRVLGYKKSFVEKAETFDFAGGMVVHMDEHHIVYYGIKKGKNVRPEILSDMNIVDLDYAFEDGSRLPPVKLFFLGSEIGEGTDAYADIEERFGYIEEERKEKAQEEDPAEVEPASKYTKLVCWDTYAERGTPPVFVAKIKADNKIEVVEFNNENGFATNIDKPEGDLNGSEITSNRSPYKGNQEFDFANARLILPLSLDKSDLIKAYKKGIGMGEKENGVLIGSFKEGGDGAGDHISVRLSCRSYAK